MEPGACIFPYGQKSSHHSATSTAHHIGGVLTFSNVEIPKINLVVPPINHVAEFLEIPLCTNHHRPAAQCSFSFMGYSLDRVNSYRGSPWHSVGGFLSFI